MTAPTQPAPLTPTDRARLARALDRQEIRHFHDEIEREEEEQRLAEILKTSTTTSQPKN